MGTLALVLSIIIGIILTGVVVLIILDESTPAAKSAWLLIITFLPIVGLVLYFLLGFNFRKHFLFNRRHRVSQEKLRDESTHALNHLLYNLDHIDKVKKEFAPFVKLMHHHLTSLSVGNSFEIITKGERKYELLLRDISAAKESIHIEYFRFGNDEGGRAVRAAMMEKARQGVKVRFIHENIANLRIPNRFYWDMTKAGVEVVKYNYPHGGFLKAFTQLNYRNHRKIVVIDGRIGYTGGMNINDHYFHEWRDTHLRIMGDAVATLQATFLDNWLTSGGKLDLKVSEYFPMLKEKIVPDFEEGPAVFHDKPMLCLPDEPLSVYPMIQLSYEWIFQNAKKYIYVQTPYMVPPPQLLDSMKIAALSGVEVFLMIPKVNDTALVGPANRAYYMEMIESGIRIFERNAEFCHAKTFVCDDYVTQVGTANLDYRSFNINSEINTYIFDEETALYYKDVFLRDLPLCDEVTAEKWSRRKWYNRFGERVMKLFAPLL